MATWAAKKNKKECSDCEKLAKQSSFAKGTRVRIAEAFDCGNCDAFKSRPLESNENALEVYDALPKNYDSMSGLRTISATDIQFLFKLYEVPAALCSLYYKKIIFFHEQLLEAIEKRDAPKKKKKRFRDSDPSSVMDRKQ